MDQPMTHSNPLQVTDAGAVNDATHHILVIETAGQRFGLPLTAVREVLPMAAPTPVPGSLALEGVLNVRGTVLPVLDLRRCLGLPAKVAEPGDHLVVGWAGQRLVAVHVDRALALIELPGGALQGVDLAPADPARVAKTADGLVVLPDLAALLAAGEGKA
jgi:purine-binding chemotaxis protein CheW